jgi:uncharacterized protein
MTVLLALIGFAVGTLVGLTGVGGGSIMTPLLVAIGVNPLIAVGTDLVLSVPTRIFGARLHFKQGTVNPQVVAYLLFGGIPAATAGLILLTWLRHIVDMHVVQSWVSHAIGASICLAAILLLISRFIRTNESATPRELNVKAYRGRLIALGAVVGLIVSVTSIGSGSVTLPLLVMLLPAAALPKLIGSDLVFSAFLIPIAAIGHWSMGDVNPMLALNLLVGSIPGVYFGSKFCRSFQQAWLRHAVAVVLMVVGMRLIVV